LVVPLFRVKTLGLKELFYVIDAKFFVACGAVSVELVSADIPTVSAYRNLVYMRSFRFIFWPMVSVPVD
jgi:hypothetical protein